MRGNREKDGQYGLDNPAYISEDGKDLEVVVDDKRRESEDIWALPEIDVEFTSWSELSTAGKVKRILWHYIAKVILLLGFLYLFICSLSFLGDAFKLLGGKAAGKAFGENEILSNPVAGLMIGILGTVLLQSSSTTTSIVVSMVGSGELLTVILAIPIVMGANIGTSVTNTIVSIGQITNKNDFRRAFAGATYGTLLTVKLAIPIVMGANIGTSVTNTIVSIGQITNKNDFRRAFAGATVHDCFNWLSVLILLPLEVASGYLEKLTSAIVSGFHFEKDKALKKDYLKVITKPFTKLIVQIDKKVIENIALGEVEDHDASIIKHCCDKKKLFTENVTEKIVNGTLTNVTEQVPICKKQCQFLFESISRDGGWSDTTVGIVLLLIALFILCVCLICLVKILHSLLRGQMAVLMRKFVNADFPGCCSYFTGYLAILVGAGMTMLLQSSSIFTSSLTPLVGMGVVSLERMYPLTLGSNIGTTATGMLAAFAQDQDRIKFALQIALCHLFFNISGILLFYPIPKFRPPIKMAKYLGCQTAKYRWFALAYLVMFFFLLPAAGFGLSIVSWIALLAVFGPIVLIIIIIFVIKLIQHRCPSSLPVRFQDLKWLPKCLRSLEPLDRAIMKLSCNCYLCRLCHCCKGIYAEYEEGEVKVVIGEGGHQQNGSLNRSTANRPRYSSTGDTKF